MTDSSHSQSGPLRSSDAPGVEPRSAGAPGRSAEPLPPPANEAPPHRTALLVVAALAATALVVWGGAAWWHGRNHVTTDNAQVEGHIIPVLPRVSGFVAEVRADENREVRAGEVLVRIDDRDLRARLAQAEADLERELANAGAGGRTGQAAAQLAAARAAVAQAEANAGRAESDVQRYRALAERSIVSRQQLDAAEAAASATRAQLEAAREQVVAAAAAVSGAEARALSARAARDQVALQLSYAAVVAPAAGVVSRKSVEVGQLVQAGQPLMSVVPLDDVWVVANLKETQTRNVTPGDRVQITADSYPGRRFSGHVESLSPATGAKFSLLPPDNATGNYTKVVQRIPVRIHLDRAQDPGHILRPGVSVKVTIEVR